MASIFSGSAKMFMSVLQVVAGKLTKVLVNWLMMYVLEMRRDNDMVRCQNLGIP